MINPEYLSRAAELANELEAAGAQDFQCFIHLTIQKEGICVRGTMRSSRELGADYFGSMLVTWHDMHKDLAALERAVRTVAATLGIH